MDFVALIWEDLAYQINNIDSKKQDKMFYPRFAKIIIHHFLEKDKSISMRNRMFMRTSRDDSLLGIMRFVSRHADTQVYGAILPQAMTNQALLDTVSYKTYYAIASGAEPPNIKENGEEDEDDENDSEDKSDDGDNDDNGNDGYDNDDDDANDDDNQEGDATNDDDKETDKEEEKIDDEETIDDEEDDEVTKELYKDVNVNLGNEDTEMTDADQGASEKQNVSQESRFEQVEEDAHVTLTLVLDTQKADEPVQSSSVSSDFTGKLLNLENLSPADNEIASLMETSARHVMAVPEITSVFTITIPQPPLFFNPLSQQATPTPTPTTFEATTSFPLLPDFSSIFKFNKRVTNLEKDLSEIKQVDQQEAQDEKNEYIELIDTSMRTIIKEEVTTQLSQILPQAVYDLVNPVIEKNVTESLEAAVLKRSSSQL
ncbi:hypothetical protein Tco_0968832 [Tanacetum coccineum]